MTKERLREKLQDKFNRENWKQIVEACFPERQFNYSPYKINFKQTKKREKVKEIYNLGEVELEEITLKFLEVELEENATKLPRNRAGLQNIIDDDIRKDVEGAAIIVYRQPDYEKWRISFYSKQFRWDEDEGIVEEETNPNRYTFLVGGDETCVTPSQQLYTLIKKASRIKLEDVMEAFSVEKVSKRFFKEYKHQYDKFVSYLTGKVWTKDGEQEVGEPINQFNFFFQATSNHEKEARDFVKKLLGRIVFLYFVQKKGWLGAEKKDSGNGSSTFIRDLFNQVKVNGDTDHFYSTWLRKLFFKGLNNKKDLSFEMPDGSTCFMPFLNGGLFEQDETDQNTEGLLLPGWLFHNPKNDDDPENSYDRSPKRGFLDFLDAFNFTIHEDSPGDHTIAVDPEMLGHIFENLLEDNKEKGTYYTPKPIVHYMCQESIIEYLNTELDGDEKLHSKIESLVKEQETGGIDHFYDEILKALKEVKVCDPAIGSGAFPMGILQEIYQIVETIYYASPDSVRATWTLDNGNWNPAAIKKKIIQHSIYGVDIEKGAVDIARLRFWLSIIVDEEEPTPLPNLEYRIRAGNSLLSTVSFNGEDEPIEIDWEIETSSGGLWGQDEIAKKQEILQEIHKKQNRFFNSEEIDKDGLGLEIRNSKIDLLINQLQLMINTQGVEKKPKGSSQRYKKRLETYLQTQEWKQTISELKRLKGQPSAPFNHFEWKLDFPEVLNPFIAGEEAGFDIVIGNPPYGAKLNDSDLLESKYKETSYGENESYKFFINKGLRLSKNGKILSFITSNSYLGKDNFEDLRTLLYDKNTHIKNINLGDNVFDDVNLPTAILFSKKGNSEQTSVLYTDVSASENEKKIANIDYEILNIDKSDISFLPQKNIINKSECSRLIDLYSQVMGVKVYQSGKGKPPQTDYERENNVFISRSKETNDHYKFIDSGVKRYEYEDNGKYIKYGKWLAEPRNSKYFFNPKVIIREVINPRIFACYVDYNAVVKNTNAVVVKKDSDYDLKYLLALLNSKLFTYYVFHNSPKSKNKSFPSFTSTLIKNLPIRDLAPEEQKVFVKLVDHLLFLKQYNSRKIADLSKKEVFQTVDSILDGLVYEIYFQEEFKEKGISLKSDIEHLVNSINDLNEGEVLNNLMDVLELAKDEDSSLSNNMERMYKLNKVQEIEREVN